MAARGSVLLATMTTLLASPCFAARMTALSRSAATGIPLKASSPLISLCFAPSAHVNHGAHRSVKACSIGPLHGPSLLRSRACDLPSVSLRASSGASDVATEKASKLRNSDPDAVCVIVGGGRGIGLAMVEDMLTRFKGHIFVTSRDPSNSEGLRQLQQEHSERITTLSMDVTSEDSVRAAAKSISADTSGRVDVILNTAGILHDQNEPVSKGKMPERQLSQVTQDWFLHNMQVNCMGPMLILKHFQPMLMATRRPFSVFASLSARVGSIEDNRLGGWYSYRVSKAAHNQLVRTAAFELNRRGSVIVALHPGTVNTGLSEPFQARVKPEKLFAVSKSAAMLLDVVDSLEQQDTGSFFAYDGTRIPW